MQKFARRYWVVAVVCALLVVGSLLAWRGSVEPAHTGSPVGVLIGQAVVEPAGVHVTWVDAWAEVPHSLGYRIERSANASEPFQSVGETAPGATSFIDPDGQEGHFYRVIARRTDSETTPSDAVKAITARVGSNVTVAEAAPTAVLGLDSAATPGQQAALLTQVIAGSWRDLAAGPNDTAHAGQLLSSLQANQRHLLGLFAQLSPTEKSAAREACLASADVQESLTHLLPEALHMDALLAQAGCSAIEQAAS